MPTSTMSSWSSGDLHIYFKTEKESMNLFQHKCCLALNPVKKYQIALPDSSL